MGDEKPVEGADLQAGLARALARAGYDSPSEMSRLTGGAMMESWRFEASGEALVLRRAPSAAFMEGRPYGHDVEAAIIRAAHAGEVTAPEVIVELDEADGIGSGFVMRALPGTPNPKAILAMDTPDVLLTEAARDLARIHALDAASLPSAIPTMDYAEAVEKLVEQFEEAGADRPIIALGLRWLRDHLPEPVEPRLNHGDFRLGNILADNSHLTGVLDWEIAHFGDCHEDLAFACLPVWRFGAYDRPAMGLGSLDDFFAAYEEAGSIKVDRDRFRFWTVYRLCWWALGCLSMAKYWREGQDRSLERVVISRRASEQELDLLLELESDAPEQERATKVGAEPPLAEEKGEATNAEIASAISDWLGTLKDDMQGHDRFQLAVARNALGMIAREDETMPLFTDVGLAEAIIAGEQTLATPGLLADLKDDALRKLAADVPKYPSLAVARAKWTGDD